MRFMGAAQADGDDAAVWDRSDTRETQNGAAEDRWNVTVNLQTLNRVFRATTFMFVFYCTLKLKQVKGEDFYFFF